MRLEELCAGWLQVPVRHRALEVGGVTCDSRQVRGGDLFVAVPGEAVDGHRFAPSAVRSGAVAVLGERPATDAGISRSRQIPYLRVPSARWALGRLGDVFWGRPSGQLEVIGVTGTKGKTTTTWLLEGLLRRLGGRPALFGTVENRFADRVEPAKNTTPACLELHERLRRHADAGGTHAVLEVSSHAIRQQRVEGIRFTAGVFTNIAPEHLDYHGTFEDYLETKISFFDDLSPDAVAVLSREDEASTRIAQRTTARIAWYGPDPQDGVEGACVGPEGLRFTWKGWPVRSRILGHHNLLNLLAALAVAENLGFPPRDIAEAAAGLRPPPGRLEDVAEGTGLRVVVDYAHTDGSLEAVLRALRPVTPGRLIAIFGCGGDRDRSKRPRMGRVAEQGSDQLILTSDNPRTEEPARILEDIVEGLERPADALVIEDRREAIGLGVRMARTGDTVLIAGKGHETYQEVGNRRLDFDDRDIARSYLRDPLAEGRT